jgi:hypothetical protein
MVEATAGKARIEHPDEGDHSVEVADDLVLTLAGGRIASEEATLLRAFLGQLRSRRARAAAGRSQGD